MQEFAEQLGLSSDKDLVEQTQKHWLRKSGQERWQMQPLTSDQHALVLQWAEKHGFFSEKSPSLDNYDQALILGSNTIGMQQRLDYLSELGNRGVRFNEVVWLVGDRPLDATVDTLFEGCLTESDAARYLWTHHPLGERLEQLPVVFVCSQMQQEAGKLRRPNTKDTLISWLETCPSGSKKALLISNQPYCSYQFAIAKAALPDTIDFEVVGPPVSPFNEPLASAVILDTIARQLYTERNP